MNAERLYSLPRAEWNALTNRGHLELPKSKKASEPFVYRGGEPPVEYGARIAVWYAAWARGRLQGWWRPKTSTDDIWTNPPVVFRLRQDVQRRPTALPRFTGDLVDRVARSIAGVQNKGCDFWQDFSANEHLEFVNMAIAALEAVDAA